MNKILFIKNKNCNARWIDNDLEILKSHYDVVLMDVNTVKGISFIIALINQLFILIFSIHKYQIIYIWFADYHSFIPILLSKIYHKKSAVVIGGYDADEILINPASSLKQKLRKFCVKYTVKNCSLLLPVSNIVKKYLTNYISQDNCTVLYNCINENLFSVKTIPTKENLIITVGGGGSFIKEAKRKKLDFFLELGNEFNETYPKYNAKFLAIGHNKDSKTYKYLQNFVKSKNVQIKPLIADLDQLKNYFISASIYMQLSLYESFGIAQAEAMIYGCIPISNPGGAIPEVVGDSGFLVDNYNRIEYIRIIKEVLDKKHENLRYIASKRVYSIFSFKTRKNNLIKNIEDLLQKKY